MKQNHISRRNFIYRVSGAVLTLWVGKGLAQSAKWPTEMQLSIGFEIGISGGFRYKPPYVAVWVENAQGTPVRNLALWFEQSRKGTRWLNELRRWYRSGSLETTTSGPTRMPGSYTLIWDGKDDKGNLLSQGDYYVCIETAREHGPYNLFREKISLSTSPQKRSYQPGGELSEVTLAYAKQG